MYIKKIVLGVILTVGLVVLYYYYSNQYDLHEASYLQVAKEAIANGKAFLQMDQEHDGAFLLTKKNNVLGTTKKCRTSGYVGLVLYELSWLRGDAMIDAICDRGARYLKNTADSMGLYSFYPDAPTDPPPDIDDTSMCALALMALNNTEPIVTLAHIHANRTWGGGYKTWFVPVGWKDEPTPIVTLNAELAEFMGRMYGNDDAYKNEYVLAWLEDGINNEKGLRAEWYTSEYYIVYIVSRNYAEGLIYLNNYNQPLIDWLIKTQNSDGSWPSSVTGRSSEFNTALAVLTLFNLEGRQHKREIVKACDFLLRSQNADGSWPEEPCFTQAPWSNDIIFSGKALSTSLAIRAIHSVVVFKGLSDS